LPDYRITCCFVDEGYRRKGMAGVALDGALHLIAQAGGGIVGSVPVGHRRPEGVGVLFLQRHAGPFAQVGFSYVRRKGKKHSVMRKVIS
jgi:hypothetical protein